MASRKQVAANRRNAKKSTGPKSRRGKQVTRINALKHGLRAEQVVIPGEDPKEFNDLFESLYEHYQPIGPVEELHFERIVVETWRLKRARLTETAIMHREHFMTDLRWANREMEWNSRGNDLDAFIAGRRSQQKSEDPERAQAYEEAEKVREAVSEKLNRPLINFAFLFQRSVEHLERLTRYETAITRRLRNAIRDLEVAQTRRKLAASDSAKVIEGEVVRQNESTQNAQDDPNKVIDMTAKRTESNAKKHTKIPRVKLR